MTSYLSKIVLISIGFVLSGCVGLVSNSIHLGVQGTSFVSKSIAKTERKLQHSDKATFEKYTIYKYNNICWKVSTKESKDISVNKQCSIISLHEKDFISGKVTEIKIKVPSLQWTGPAQTFSENNSKVEIVSGKETIIFSVSNKFGSCSFPTINKHKAKWLIPCQSMEIQIRHTHNRKGVYYIDTNTWANPLTIEERLTINHELEIKKRAIYDLTHSTVSLVNGQEHISFKVSNQYGTCSFPEINNIKAWWIEPCNILEIEPKHTHNAKAVFNISTETWSDATHEDEDD